MRSVDILAWKDPKEERPVKCGSCISWKLSQILQDTRTQQMRPEEEMHARNTCETRDPSRSDEFVMLASKIGQTPQHGAKQGPRKKATLIMAFTTPSVAKELQSLGPRDLAHLKLPRPSAGGIFWLTHFRVI